MTKTASGLLGEPAEYYSALMGNTVVYLIKGTSGYILVDVGNTGGEKKLVRFLKRHEILPQDIHLIVITHPHYDHIRGLSAVKRLCNCPIAVGKADAHLLETGGVVVPPGVSLTGKASSFLLTALRDIVRPRLARIPPEIVIDAETSLEPFGINGRIVPTPGHTPGSISVLLETGEAFVGDLAVNFSPYGYGPIMPPFAEDVDEVLVSWQRLLDKGVIKILPAHIRPFPAALLQDKMREINSGVLRSGVVGPRMLIAIILGAAAFLGSVIGIFRLRRR